MRPEGGARLRSGAARAGGRGPRGLPARRRRAARRRPGRRAGPAVYCSITGFGTERPHASARGHDLNYLGWAGVLEDTAPALPPLQIADLAAGALGAVAEILAALLERERTGRGARLDDLDDARLAPARLAPARRRPAAAVPHRRARLLPDLRDGGRAHLTVGALEPKFFGAALRADRATGARGAPVRRRARTRSPRSSQRVFATRPLAEWLELFDGEDVCVGPVATLAEGAAAFGGGTSCRPPASGSIRRHGGPSSTPLIAVALAPLPLLAAVAWNTDAEAARGLPQAVVSVRNGDLYVGERQVTSGGGDSDPDWSPDRRRIAFVRQEPRQALLEPVRDPP